MRLLTLAAVAALAGGAWHYRQSHLRRRARRATDNELGRRLKAAIEGSVAEPSKVRVLVKGTRVTLRGTVRREERDFVLAAALGAPGVTTVNNLLNVLDEGSDLGPMQAGFATGPWEVRGNTLRRAAERGQSRQGWLESFHSFSVGDYYDPDLAAYGPLLSLNERIAQPGGGYSTYGQRHMEVVTYVLEGEFGHEDSMGNSETLLPGEVQLVSAGTGIRRSELNRSDSQPVRYLQIWISPEAKDTRSTYQRARFAAEERRGRLRLIASADGRNASLRIRQQVSIYAGLFDGGERAELALAPGRHAYVHIARGTIEADGECLLAGDGLMSEAQRIVLERGAGAEVLVFDLP